MNLADFDSFIARRSTEILNTVDLKCKEYGNTDNALFGFSGPCVLSGKTPFETWLGFWGKGIITLYKMIRSGETHDEKYLEKIEDSVNYLVLLDCLVQNTKMSYDEMHAEAEKFLIHCKDVLDKKREMYMQVGADRLGMFKETAEILLTTPEDALIAFMQKHTQSIIQAIRCNPDADYEFWLEKITDHVNYLLLLGALYEDLNNDSTPELNTEVTTTVDFNKEDEDVKNSVSEEDIL